MDNTLNIKIQAEVREALNKLKELNKTLNDVGKEAKEAAEKTKSSFSAMDIWASFQIAKGAIQSVISTLDTFVDASNRYNLAMKGLSETARAFGQDQQLANQYAKQLASDGLISVESAARTLKSLLSSNYSLSDAFEMAKGMKDIGAFNNILGNLGEAMETYSKGLKTGSIESLDNLGVVTKLSKVMKDYNIDVSNGIDVTNNANQRLAAKNALMKDALIFEGNAAQLAKEGAGAYAQLATAWNALKVQIGDTLNTVFVPMVKQLVTLVTFLKDHLPLAAGLAVGALTGVLVATSALTIGVASLATAITGATAGMNLLVGAAVALGVGGAVAGVTYAMEKGTTTADQYTESMNKATSAVKNLNKEQLENTIAVLKLEERNRALIVMQLYKEIDALKEQNRIGELSPLWAKLKQLEQETELRKNATNALLVYNNQLKLVNKTEADKPVAARSKDEYLDQLKAKVKAGGELSKTEKEIFDNNFVWVDANLRKTGQAIDGYYRRKSELANKDSDEAKARFKRELAYHKDWNADRIKADDAYHDNVEKIAKIKEKAGDKEIKAFQDNFKKQQKVDQGKNKKDQESFEDSEKRRKAENDAIKEKAATEKAAQDAGWNSTLQLGAMMAQKSKEGFIANQALQIANATMSTFAAASKALEAGPIAGPIFSAITIAAGLANVGMIASQTYEPVNDFISIPGKPLLKANEDDIVIGGTNLLGGKGGGNNNSVVDAIREQTQVLKRKQMAVSVDPLTGETVYSQNLKGQKTVDRKRI